MPDDNLRTPTDQMLNFPKIIAKRLCRGDAEKMEELESEGYLCLLKACRKFDVTKSPNGEEGFAPYVYRHIEFGLKKKYKLLCGFTHRGTKKLTLQRIDLEEFSVDLEDLSSDKPEATVLVAEEYQLALQVIKQLPPVDRFLYLLHEVNGLSRARIAAKLANALHETSIGTRLKQIRKFVAKSVLIRNLGTRPPPNCIPPQLTKYQKAKHTKAVARTNKSRAIVNHLQGKLPLSDKYWCVVNDKRKTIRYVSRHLTHLLAKLGWKCASTCPSKIIQFVNLLQSSGALHDEKIVRTRDAQSLLTDHGYSYLLTEDQKPLINKKRYKSKEK